MFDFRSLAKSSASDVPGTLGELFKQLDRKTSHASLRPAQVAALSGLDQSLDQRDVITKLSTGSGKTVVGLVYAEMMRRKYKGEPVVYLCPTKQLVEQVVATGQLVGVPVSTFPDSSPPYGAMRGDSVLVCTYDKLFTCKSVFESHPIRPSTIVLDDVHVGVERVRKYFTVQVPDGCLGDLKALLKPLCEGTDSATWSNIAQGTVPGSAYEVPYWVWTQVNGQVADMLKPYTDKPPLLFHWDNIARYIELARCCISGNSAEIALQIPPVEGVTSYAGAKHRLFMSASIKDISGLISVLDCDPKACTRLIEPAEDEGAGERMILPTSLINPDAQKADVAAVCAELAKQTNVVVLTTSAAQAKTWTDAGATLSQNSDFGPTLEELRTSTAGKFVAFAQRFDGVDLPDDACRILVIDGVPGGERTIDHVDAYRQKDSPEYDVRTVNKFEQALGRAVRSSADYAAVLLVGPDIAAFIGRKSVADLLEERTRLQVELGQELAQKVGEGRPIGKVLSEMTQALLSRDEGWKEEHRKRVGGQAKRLRVNQLTPIESAAVVMRKAWHLVKAKNFQDAVTCLREAVNTLSVHPIQKAELLYWVSAYYHHFDPVQAAQTYQAVFNMNTKFPRPDKVVARKLSRRTQQAVAVCNAFSDFASANAALVRLSQVKAKLPYSGTAETVEQGLKELGELLGADSSRPEKETGRGPDVLWLFDDCGACIEAKSEKTTASIDKKEANQLLGSMQWCGKQLAAGVAKPEAVFATNVTTADRAEDIAFGPKMLNEAAVMDIIERLGKVVLSLSYEGSWFTDPATVGKKLTEMGVSGVQIIKRMPVMRDQARRRPRASASL